MFKAAAFSLAILLWCGLASCFDPEEFQAHGPTEFYDLAMKAFSEARKLNPQEKLDADSPFMQRATEHAVNRLQRKADASLILRKEQLLGLGGSDENARILELPSPDGEGSALSKAVNTQGSMGGELISTADMQANAIAFNEAIGLGAISKTGALVMGEEGQWLQFAEKKLKKDADLDYQTLLWELGSAEAEKAQTARGGMNITHEEKLLAKLEEWFVKGGGKLKYIKPSVSRENGFQLLANEDIPSSDAFVSAPLKLIMCKQTAMNVVIPNRGKYLGEELQKTFERDELQGMAIFLLHEYYKEMNGKGSKWGPFIRTLRMRQLSTPVLQGLKGTLAGSMHAKWTKQCNDFMWWSVGIDGPCSPTTGICKTKPLEKAGDSRFNIHHIRWAYWVVKQNAVKIKHMTTGLEFIALIPYYNMAEKRFGSGGGVTFDQDGSVSLRVGDLMEEGVAVGLHPGNMSDSEFFLRYFKVPAVDNPHTEIKLSLPGVIPKGSKFHYCLKGTTREMNRDDCKASYRSESMFWKSKVLTEWRKLMNLPPRMQELRMWATRLHLYGSKEEMALLSNANRVIAGLPLPVDQMSAEEQLMLMGYARDGPEAALMVTGGNNAFGTKGDGAPAPPPQLYSAPDPEEDFEAQRGMENLAMLALQAQNVISGGNTMLNATQVVLNQTRDFFEHGVLPSAGLDELDNFLLKKIGMLAHCGFENDMKIVIHNVTEQLKCAMRVHLMNESEVHVFCPKEARVWEDACVDVAFMNYTAVSVTNEMNMINALRGSISTLLGEYPTTIEEDRARLEAVEAGRAVDVGPIVANSIKLAIREKEILFSALEEMDKHEAAVKNGTIQFQLALKAQERVEADIRAEAHKKFKEEVQARAKVRESLATLEVDLGEKLGKQNLTLEEGRDLKGTVKAFCNKFGVQAQFVSVLEEKLKARVVSPTPLALMLGAIISTGDRKILAIPEGANTTVETGVFCTKWDSSPNPLDSEWCQKLMKRVEQRMNPSFLRRILVVVPINAPDGRTLKLVVREGEQHDLIQFTTDFFELYHMPMESVEGMANEVWKRLSEVKVQVPISLQGKRGVTAHFRSGENITAVVEGFANFYELDDNAKIAIRKRAESGMKPGTFLA